MSDNIPINEIKPGMVLSDNKNRRYVVIDTNLNGDDYYYSTFEIISEDEFLSVKGKIITKNELKTLYWLEMTEYRKYYKNCKDKYSVSSQKIFIFK